MLRHEAHYCRYSATMAFGRRNPRISVVGGIVMDTVGNQDIVLFAPSNGTHGFVNLGYTFEKRSGEICADGTS